MRGRDKLLENLDGQPILRRAAMTAIAARLGSVIAGIGPDDGARREALGGLDVRIIEVEDAGEGMAATLRAGASAARIEIETDVADEKDRAKSGMLVLLPDMPEIESADLNALDHVFRASGGAAVRATSAKGKVGHPVLFPYSLLGDFVALEGDRGAASLLADARTVGVPLAGQRAILDLDTPEDWEAWRAGSDRKAPENR